MYVLKGWDLKMMEGNATAVNDIVRGTVVSLQSVLAVPAIFSCSAGYAVLEIMFGAMKYHNMYHLNSHVASAGPLNKFVWTSLAFQCLLLLCLMVIQ